MTAHKQADCLAGACAAVGFRQAALVSSKKVFSEFETEFAPLMARLEAARKNSLTAPEWCFARAQKKIEKGDYDFDVDSQGIDAIGHLGDGSATKS